MPNYRRVRVQSARYFFTVALADRGSTLLVDHIHSLRAAFRAARKARPFAVDAIVVLPEHLHCLWTLPDGDTDCSTRWAHLKAMFLRNVDSVGLCNESHRKRRERGIWQRRFWERAICNEDDYRRHLDYIHFNPIKHGWAETPADWPFSSFRHFVARSLYPLDWGAQKMDASNGALKRTL